MSQLILDDQLDTYDVLTPIQRWITAEHLRDLRPGELILDERVPEILLTLKHPTFVTIDQGFWHSRWCNPQYGILYFALRSEEQASLPSLLRTFLRRPEFRSRAKRMGKVVRISPIRIDYWQFQMADLQHIAWRRASRKKRSR